MSGDWWRDKRWVRKNFTVHRKEPISLAVALAERFRKWGVTMNPASGSELESLRLNIADLQWSRSRWNSTVPIECFDATNPKHYLMTLSLHHKASMFCCKPVFDK